MPNADFNQRIRDAIEAFVEELSTLVRGAALQSVTEVFGSSGPGGRRGRGGLVAGPSRRAKGEKRSPQALTQLVSRLLSEIKAKPGLRMEQIAKALGSTTKDLALPAKKLIAEKKIKTKGERRATKYFPA
jgi:hypothetical protein